MTHSTCPTWPMRVRLENQFCVWGSIPEKLETVPRLLNCFLFGFFLEGQRSLNEKIVKMGEEDVKEEMEVSPEVKEEIKVIFKR